ncbi:hypothetical protein AYI68_g3963 [Smittium mucronatum]|uniref:Uncharacterized protein n=1 Tax=Smittium mucronatum TaxID=133383 RepID=A0A1R0GYD7_9FUNG|nr:hypothetical protein AYI68_g3963 [Smittium mucronatum]
MFIVFVDCEGISLDSAIGMVMRNYDLVESGAYPYGFYPEASESISIEALELSGDLDPSVKLAGGPVMKDIVSSLLGLSLVSGPNPPVRFSPIVPTAWAVQTLSVVSTGSNGQSDDRRSKGAIPALKSHLGEGEGCASNSVLNVASPLAAQLQFRSEDLYQSNWYRESSSEKSIYNKRYDTG